MGRPEVVRPQFTLIPGIPARFAEMFRISERYIWSGSSIFSPNLKAAVGEVGVTITSQCWKAWVKSSRMRERTLRAFR